MVDLQERRLRTGTQMDKFEVKYLAQNEPVFNFAFYFLDVLDPKIAQKIYRASMSLSKATWFCPLNMSYTSVLSKANWNTMLYFWKVLVQWEVRTNGVC